MSSQWYSVEGSHPPEAVSYLNTPSESEALSAEIRFARSSGLGGEGGVGGGVGVGVGTGDGVGVGVGGVGGGVGGAGLSQSELFAQTVTPSLPQIGPLPPDG